VLLLEFCGWTEKLIAREKNNGSKTGFGVQGEKPLAAVLMHVCVCLDLSVFGIQL
jgi:hypothetical protein